jgi:uncharacterized phiE125 gp8 family phage protein
VRTRIVTPPATEPVTLAEAKSHLRVDISEDDAYINSLITVAREFVETATKRALITQTVDYIFDGWPEFPVTLPRPPLQSVASITYIDHAGATQTLDPSLYFVDTAGPGRVGLSPGLVLPIASDRIGSVTIRAVNGYGAAAAVPARAKAAMLLLVGNLYENREPTISGTIVAKVQFTLESLLGSLDWGYVA